MKHCNQGTKLLQWFGGADPKCRGLGAQHPMCSGLVDAASQGAEGPRAQLPGMERGLRSCNFLKKCDGSKERQPPKDSPMDTLPEEHRYMVHRWMDSCGTGVDLSPYQQPDIPYIMVPLYRGTPV